MNTHTNFELDPFIYTVMYATAFVATNFTWYYLDLSYKQKKKKNT